MSYPNYGYGAPSAQPPYGAQPPYAPYGAPTAPYGVAPTGEKPHKADKPPKDQAGAYGAAAPPLAAGGYPPAPMPFANPFAALMPSQFPPGTDPNLVSCFQMTDKDQSGFIDDKELKRALSTYNQSFSMRTIRLLMYMFTNTNTRKIGEP